MASNSFGKIFRITTWGESHGKAIGVVIDGCPAGLGISEEYINQELSLRSPGKSALTSPRKEPDIAQIMSGTFDGKTTGAPISIIIYNQDADSSKYEPIKDLLRPGHANFTYLEKYGIFDYRGGGRSSARETACRVAAGAVAKKLLEHFKIEVDAWVHSIAGEEEEPKMHSRVMEAKRCKDSVGGIIAFQVLGMPTALGDPVYEKLEANLAKAMMSIPATKGFEMGSGFEATEQMGSEQNDTFYLEGDRIRTETNYSGGTLGGISTGMPLSGKVAFKPTSSILKEQQSVNYQTLESATFQLPEGSRHDPCVVLRAAPVVRAMVSLVLADALLMNRASRL